MPLGEESESYLLRILKDGEILREVIVSQPEYTYSAQRQASDGASGEVAVDVAQISATYGAGLTQQLSIVI